MKESGSATGAMVDFSGKVGTLNCNGADEVAYRGKGLTATKMGAWQPLFTKCYRCNDCHYGSMQIGQPAALLGASRTALRMVA